MNRRSSTARSRRSRFGPRFEPHPTRQRAMLSPPRAALRPSHLRPTKGALPSSPCDASVRFYRASRGRDYYCRPAQPRAVPAVTRHGSITTSPARSGGTSRPRPQVVDYRSLSRRPPNIVACCECLRAQPSREHPCSLIRQPFPPYHATASRSGDEVGQG